MGFCNREKLSPELEEGGGVNANEELAGDGGVGSRSTPDYCSWSNGESWVGIWLVEPGLTGSFPGQDELC